MNEYMTIVICMPKGDSDKQQCSQALKMLEPFCSARSNEDEMTVLELIEHHADFEPHIAVEARNEANKLNSVEESS